MADEALVMPDLVGIRRSVRHGVDSAVLSLLRIGIDLGRIVLESAGPGESAGTVVSQSPAPGAVLTPVSRVVLRVGGSGAHDLMPFPLRDESDTELRGDRLFAIFDNPALKLGFYLRHGGAYLALHADEPITARRWLEDLFLISAEPWPAARWHAVARLVPRLHALGGTTSAVRVAMIAMFDLPVHAVRVTQGVIALESGAVMRLGERNGRLGFDAMLGSGIVGDSHIEITFGPVSLDGWRRHFTAEALAERQALYPLLLPAHLSMSVSERWRVGDAGTGARVGDGTAPALLGVNAYLGTVPIGRAA